jgi:plasmid maintenance system killer protein
VEIEYSTGRLATASTNIAEAVYLLGVPVGRKYIQRIAVLRATDKFSQLYGHRALHLHPLKGDHVGQYTVKLTGNYRLILERRREDEVFIVGVEDHHGD